MDEEIGKYKIDCLKWNGYFKQLSLICVNENLV